MSVRFEVHLNQISQWKQEVGEHFQKVFSGAGEKEKEESFNIEAPYAKIGQLEMEQDFLKSIYSAGAVE